MANKLIWAILGGVILGAGFGYAGGNTAIGIAVCTAAGAIAAGVWQYLEDQRKRDATEREPRL
jgi:hypothetical protein